MSRRWTVLTALVGALLLSLSAVSVDAGGARHAGSGTQPAGVIPPVVARLGAYTDVSMEIDGLGHIQAVAAGNSGLWYLTNKTGVFTRKRITTVVSRPLSHGRDSQPSLALDSHNHAYVAFVRNDCDDCAPSEPFGIYYVTNKSGSWSSPKKLAGQNMDAPSLQVHGTRISMSWERCGCIPELTEQVWYGTNASGTWTKTKVAQNASSPSLALSSSGKPRIAFSQNGIRYAIGASKLGNFSIQKITGSTSHDSRPALALSPSGLARVAWSRYGTAGVRGLYDGNRSGGGTWSIRRLDPGQGSVSIDAIDNSNWSIGVAEDSGGALVAIATVATSAVAPIAGGDTVDRIDTEIIGMHAYWMYTVTGGDPLGIYYTHS